MRWRSGGCGTLLFFLLAVNAKELYRRIVCESEDLDLDCAPKSFLAIHNASFTTDVVSENITCEDFEISDSLCTEDIRIPINRRCSGLNNCTYSHDDAKDRKCPAAGAVVVLYDCVRESWLHRYCNARITASEGYVVSPGYPLYYPRLPTCGWNVVGGEGQTVSVSVLHLAMSLPSRYYGRDVCHDSSVSITEGSNKLFIGCGESLDSLKFVESETNEISLRLFSASFVPASGFLLYFKLQGCATLPAPQNGYLVYRNGSVAIYTCCGGYLFNDTLDSSRTLQCGERNRWNSSLPSCVSLEELGETRNLTEDFLGNLLLPINTTENEALVEPVVSSDTFLEDIIIPTVILVALLIGNAVILYIILHIRRRQKQKQATEEGEALNTTHITTSAAAQGTNV